MSSHAVWNLQTLRISGPCSVGMIYYIRFEKSLPRQTLSGSSTEGAGIQGSRVCVLSDTIGASIASAGHQGWKAVQFSLAVKPSMGVRLIPRDVTPPATCPPLSPLYLTSSVRFALRAAFCSVMSRLALEEPHSFPKVRKDSLDFNVGLLFI